MKGSLLDIGGILVAFFLLVIFSFVIYSVNTTNNQAIGNLTVASGLNATVMNQITNDSATSSEIMLSAVPFVTLAMALGSFILAALIPASPVLIIASFIFIIVYEILSALFANILFDFITSSMFISIANTHPLIVLFIEKLPWVVGIVWFILVVILYTNPTQQNGKSGWG